MELTIYKAILLQSVAYLLIRVAVKLFRLSELMVAKTPSFSPHTALADCQVVNSIGSIVQ